MNADPAYWYLFRKAIQELIDGGRLWIRFVGIDGSELAGKATAYVSGERVTIVAERQPPAAPCPDDRLVRIGLVITDPPDYAP